MQTTILLEPLTNRAGYRARLGEPFNIEVEAATEDEALELVNTAVQQRLQGGARLVPLSLRGLGATLPPGGWLPDDELTRDWLKAVEEYRQKCDREDRERDLAEEGANGESST
jgi:hypothetical protein